MRGATTVDAYIAGLDRWAGEVSRLRKLLLGAGLTETVKWGGPCYTHRGKNVVGLGAFKSYFGLWFHQGALLEDTDGVLINAQEGKTKALRQWRMTRSSDVVPARVRRYVEAAMRLVDEGREIKPARKTSPDLPPELRDALAKDPRASAAFERLTPGRRREYADHVAEAKRADTKTRRVRKALPLIRAGKGLNDRWR